MSKKLIKELNDFFINHHFSSKSKLCVALVVTQHAKNMGLPLQSDTLLTEKGGQVLGLGKAAVQSILARHGITKVLAQEGGRTSRGSIDAMKNYVVLLNSLHDNDLIELKSIESFWIDKVKAFFSAKPFKLKLDSSKGMRNLVRDLIEQADVKQKSAQGMYYVGAILQHLVGAKLDCALGPDHFTHNSFSTSDMQSGRQGDFVIGDVALHVTTTPSEGLMQKCQENLDQTFRPIIVTTKRGLTLAEGLSENAGISSRVDIFEIEQFIALNIYEFAKFGEQGRTVAIKDIIARYNEIVSEFETDPSLRIEFA